VIGVLHALSALPPVLTFVLLAGDLKNKIKKGKLMNNIKATGNSIKENHDNRLENSVIHRDDDALRYIFLKMCT
jgi:hypothetical protein